MSTLQVLTPSSVKQVQTSSGGTKIATVGSTDIYAPTIPAIPTVNNSTISFTQGGVSKGSFTLNQSCDATIALDAGGGGGGLTGHTVTISISYTSERMTQMFYFSKADGTYEWVSASSGTITKSNVTSLTIFAQSYWSNGLFILLDGKSISLPAYGNSSSFPAAEPRSNVTFFVSRDMNIELNYQGSCFLRGTPITLADGTHKNAEDITYDDDLLVWNFDDGVIDHAHPFYIRNVMQTDKYWVNAFADGRVVKTTGSVAGHRFYSVDDGKFLYNTECVGKRIFMEDGTTSVLVSADLVNEPCEYYNLYTEHHMNCFIGGALGSVHFNNLYPINGMKFVKDNRTMRSRDEFAEVGDEWFSGLRLAEQIGDAKEICEYIKTRAMFKKEM